MRIVGRNERQQPNSIWASTRYLKGSITSRTRLLILGRLERSHAAMTHKIGIVSYDARALPASYMLDDYLLKEALVRRGREVTRRYFGTTSYPRPFSAELLGGNIKKYPQ